MTTKRRARKLTTTERLVASLDVIRYELDRMEIAIMDATDMTTNARSTIRRGIGHLVRHTETLLGTLSARD